MANFTEKAIIETLNDMLQKRTIDKITVKDLTEACGISRNTFYYHFHDLYEVLSKSFTEQIDAILDARNEKDSWEDTFLEVLGFLYENKTSINHIYWSVDEDILNRFLDEVVYHYARGVVKEESGTDQYKDKTISLAADFYKNALLGAVIGWIENDMKESPEELAHLYNSVFKGTIDSLLNSIERVV